jgi:hypothetical protein
MLRAAGGGVGAVPGEELQHLVLARHHVGFAQGHQFARVGRLEQQVAGQRRPAAPSWLPAAHAHAAQQAAHRRRQAAEVARGHVVQPLAGRDDQRFHRPQRRVLPHGSGSSASVRLMRCMRSMSTASASRKMLAMAWPAICARLG